MDDIHTRQTSKWQTKANNKNKRLTVCHSLKTYWPCFSDFPCDGCYIRTNVFKRVPHAHRRSPGAKSGVLSRHQEAGFVA